VLATAEGGSRAAEPLEWELTLRVDAAKADRIEGALWNRADAAEHLRRRRPRAVRPRRRRGARRNEQRTHQSDHGWLAHLILHFARPRPLGRQGAAAVPADDTTNFARSALA